MSVCVAMVMPTTHPSSAGQFFEDEFVRGLVDFNVSNVLVVVMMVVMVMVMMMMVVVMVMVVMAMVVVTYAEIVLSHFVPLSGKHNQISHPGGDNM